MHLREEAIDIACELASYERIVLLMVVYLRSHGVDNLRHVIGGLGKGENVIRRPCNFLDVLRIGYYDAPARWLCVFEQSCCILLD